MVRRSLSIFFAVLFALAPASLTAGNPYGIDDDCYRLMVKADALIGKEGFDRVNDSLLVTALAKGDKKAEVLFYVEKLRDACRHPGATDEGVLSVQEELKAEAARNGFYQYYYQSYQFVKNFYFNSGRVLKALECVQDMYRDALNAGNDYGLWLSDEEIASIYLAYGAGNSARNHLRRLIQTWEKTDDPIVRRQPVSTYYLYIAETFPPTSDSTRFYIRKAWDGAKIPIDSVRCLFASAKIAAMDGDLPAYRRYRDLCMNTEHRQAVNSYYSPFFNAVDQLFAGTYDPSSRDIFRKIPTTQLRFLSCIAETAGNYPVAGRIKDNCYYYQSNDISTILDMNLSEMDARFENHALQARLDDKTRQMRRLTRIATAALLVVLVAIVVMLLLHIRNLRKRNRKDRQMIEDLTEARKKARAADEAKTHFLQNMTHELRTPLNAITGFSQLLSMPDGLFSAKEKEEFGHHIVNSTKMMTMLLDDIINSSDMDGGNYSVHPEETECGGICKEALSAAEHRLQPGVELKFLPGMELPFRFVTDPLRVQQILTNLLTNACKYTQKGEVRLGCTLRGNVLEFSVEDTGPGIPAHEAERVFERFVKLDEFVQGTGLGLSICREIAAKLGGEVHLDTSYTAGARFVFSLDKGFFSTESGSPS